MKRKFISILLTLVLALSLCLVTAAPAVADTAAGVILIGDGIAKWSMEESHSGYYSVKLKTGLPDWGSWAGLQIPCGQNLDTFIATGGGEDAILDVFQTNFYYHMELDITGQVPIMALVFEGMGDGATETWKLILAPPEQPTDTGSGEWVQLTDAFTTSHLWRSDGPSEWNGEWGPDPLYEEFGWWQNNQESPIKGKTVDYVEVSIGTEEATIFIDDVAINGVTHDLEPATGTVGMTAAYEIAPPPLIGISVSPAALSFGDVEPGVASNPQEVTVTNTGDIPENFSATIAYELPAGVYTGTPGLKIDALAVSDWGEAGVPPVVDNTVLPELILTVPSGTAPGTYTATLVFWAEPTVTP